MRLISWTLRSGSEQYSCQSRALCHSQSVRAHEQSTPSEEQNSFPKGSFQIFALTQSSVNPALGKT